MVNRDCAGGVVFFGDRVFLLQNDKEEWVLPKGAIRERQNARDVALARVLDEAGIRAQILTEAGDTAYEFYSVTRRKPVSNRVKWFVMRAESEKYRIAFEQGFLNGDFFDLESALEKITYSQDRALLKNAYARYREVCGRG